MKNLKQIGSLILFLLIIASTVFNVLYLLDIISRSLMQTVFIIFIAALFIISLLGLILKDKEKDATAPLNIFTPVKEIGKLYVWVFIIWIVTYVIAILFKESLYIAIPGGAENWLPKDFSNYN